MDKEKLEMGIRESFKKVFLEQPQLNIGVIGERALCFRFAGYLIGYFPEYHVDSEYNYDIAAKDPKRVLNEGKLKELASKLKKSSVRKTRLTIPDIIIHKRSIYHDDNAVVIEVKFSDSSQLEREFDIEKLNSIKEKFGYQYSAMIVVPRKWDQWLDKIEVKIF